MGVWVKNLYFSFSVFAFFALVQSNEVLAVTSSDMQGRPIQVELTAQNPNYSSSSDINAGNGFGIYINQTNQSFNSTISNSGTITAEKTNGLQGYGIWGEATPTAGGQVLIENTGTINFIQLSEFDNVAIRNSSAAKLGGDILLGTTAKIMNYGGTIDASHIVFAYDGMLNNGVETFYTLDESGNYSLANVT